MTAEEFISECATLGLTYRQEVDKNGSERYIIVETEIGGRLPCWYRPVRGGYVLGWGWSFDRYDSVLGAVLAAQADGMPYIIDPIKIAGLAFNHQREDEGPRGS